MIIKQNKKTKTKLTKIFMKSFDKFFCLLIIRICIQRSKDKEIIIVISCKIYLRSTIWQAHEMFSLIRLISSSLVEFVL